MQPISAAQIKAARAMLDWSQVDLADKARLSITTVRSLEMGFAPRASTAKEIRNAIEDAGLEFTDGEGIRRRMDEIRIYRGEDSCDRFFDDMLKTVTQKGGEIVSFVRSQDMLMRSCGISHDNDFERMSRLQKITSVKCLMLESVAADDFLPAIEFRIISKPCVSPSPFYVYGNKYAIILSEDGVFKFVVFTMMEQAQAYRSHFLTLWNQALPIQSRSKRRV